MRKFFHFSFQKIVAVPVLACIVFSSYASADQFEVSRAGENALDQKVLASGGNATTYSGYSHKKKEGSANQSHSHSKKGYFHGPEHGKDSGSHGRYSSYGHGSGHSNNPFHHVLRFKEAINLTEDQVMEIKNKKFEYEKQVIKFYAEKKIAKMELERVLHSENMDETHARNLATQIAQLKGQMFKVRVEAKISVMNLLTAEQRKKVGQMYGAHN